MTKRLSLQTALFCFVMLVMSACKKETSADKQATEVASKLNGQKNMNIFYGESVMMGNGTARAFIALNPAGRPMEIGIEMTDESLEGLEHGEMDHPEYILQLPAQALNVTPYKHFVINWNPHGHPLEGIYTVPHFDFHFYTITNEERMAIGFNPGAPPAPGYLPAGHVPAGPVPQMGMHWVDPTAPEFNGHPFTYTIMYGSYNGAVTFTEPMITMDILQSGKAYNKIKIPQPTYYSPTNTYYPKHYNIYMDPATQKHYVTYTEFTKQ